MSAKQEALKNNKQQHEQKLNVLNTKQGDIDEKLSVLRTLDKKLIQVKDDLTLCKNRIKNKNENLSSEWKGENALQLKEYVADELLNSYSSYYSKVDELHDRVCDEITRLKNQKSENEGIIGSLKKCINQISNEIDKFFN